MSVPTDAHGNGAPFCQVIGPEHSSVLADFFERLHREGVEKFFHPHPLTAGEAAKRAAYRGRDFYCVLMRERAVIGYGMLRGWDDGYETPSLGIAIAPGMQGRGLGRMLMEFLHAEARQRGADRIRLKVHAENVRAVALYQSLGYEFPGGEGGQMTGFLALARGTCPAQDRKAK